MTVELTTEQTVYIARQVMAAALAGALADPQSPLASRGQGLDFTILQFAWKTMHEALAGQAPTVTDTALKQLAAWIALTPDQRELAWQSIYGLVVSKECPPYEAEYCSSKDANQRAARMADVAGLYHAFGFGVMRDHPERPDHVALEVEFVALLHEKYLRAQRHEQRAGQQSDQQAEQLESCDEALKHFLKDHILRWVPSFAQRLAARAQTVAWPEDPSTTYMPGVAMVLETWVELERLHCGLPDQPWRPEPVLDAEPEAGSCEDCCPLSDSL